MRDHVLLFLDSEVSDHYYESMNGGHRTHEYLRALLCNAPFRIGRIQDIQPYGQCCDWSEVYCLRMDDGDRRLFLKGMPRSRHEVQVMQWLAPLCPQHILQIIVADLSPYANWQWCVMEDAGETKEENLSFSLALQTAFNLGSLQRRASTTAIPPWLIQCQGDHLQRCVLDVCSWVLEQHLDGAVRSRLERITLDLSEASDFFKEVSAALATVPPTIVHVDLWSGNIAHTEGMIRFINWGDVL